jgi:hypothetical protein
MSGLEDSTGRRLRVYLSGGMEYAADEGRDWRNTLQQWIEQELGWDVFNPNHESDTFLAQHLPNEDLRRLKADNPSRYQTLVSRLVELDCREIAERSDVVLCYWDESAARGAGTKGELTMAKYFNKPVYVVTSYQPRDIPGWVLGCTTKMFVTFDELKIFLSLKR